jgi:hypothetical protein
MGVAGNDLLETIVPCANIFIVGAIIRKAVVFGALRFVSGLQRSPL